MTPLIQARCDLGLSPDQLARAAQVPPKEYKLLESGKRKPLHSGEWRPEVRSLAAFHGIPPEDLFPDHAPIVETATFRAPVLPDDITHPEEYVARRDALVVLLSSLAHISSHLKAFDAWMIVIDELLSGRDVSIESLAKRMHCKYGIARLHLLRAMSAIRWHVDPESVGLPSRRKGERKEPCIFDSLRKQQDLEVRIRHTMRLVPFVARLHAYSRLIQSFPPDHWFTDEEWRNICARRAVLGKVYYTGTRLPRTNPPWLDEAARLVGVTADREFAAICEARRQDHAVTATCDR